MGLPSLAGSVVRKFGGRVVQKVTGLVGRKIKGRFVGGARGRRRGIPSLSPNEMGKLMLMSQVLGKRSPAMTLIVMKALRGRL
jgi:hypothetical protein